MNAKHKRMMAAILAVIVMMMAFGLMIFFDQAGILGDGSGIIMSAPIWLVIIIAAIFAAWRRQEAEGQEKAKREPEDENFNRVMDHLVDDLDVNERQYLRQRLVEAHGAMLVDSY